MQEHRTYLESVPRLVTGCNSTSELELFRSRSQISSLVSLEKSASTAPARVPVAIDGFDIPADQAKAAVLGISRIGPIVKAIGVVERGCFYEVPQG